MRDKGKRDQQEEQDRCRRTGLGGRCLLDPNMIHYRVVRMQHIVEPVLGFDSI